LSTTRTIDHHHEAIAENLTRVRQQIVELSKHYNRGADTVSLLAVSKTRPITDLQVALAEGQRHFGENYLQEALDKILALGETDTDAPQWHYIGAIQSNKTRPIAEHFDWVHTLSSSKIATRLANQRTAARMPLNVLLQVNIDAEDSKAGVLAADLMPLIDAILPLPNLALRGLMAIPKAAATLDAQRRPFRQLRELLNTAQQHYGADLPGFDQLSMGMSADIEAAIAEGSTWVRVGTAIFGERPGKGNSTLVPEDAQ
jgi:PLP dependent protein